MATISRRFALSLVVILISACCTTGSGPTYTSSRAVGTFDLQNATQALSARCQSGVGWNNPNGPVICVERARRAANPDSIHVYDQQESSEKKGTGQPVWVAWFADSGSANLSITVLDSGCVEKPSCARDMCVAKVIMGGGHRECRYTVGMDGKAADPVIIVDPCCG